MKYSHKILLGVVAILSFNLPLCTAADSVVEEAEIAIRKSLRLKKKETLKATKEKRKIVVPFILVENKLFIVVERNLLVARKGKSKSKSIPTQILFSPEGQFIRAESVQTVKDPWRRDKKTLEKSLGRSEESVVSIGNTKEVFPFAVLWKKVCRRYQMENATEFNCTLVKYDFGNNQKKTVIIMNILGLQNPLGITHEMPKALKNRIRIIFDLKGDEISADNIL